MIQSWMERCALAINQTRARWKWLGTALSVAATVYLAALIIYGGYQARDIHWQAFWLPSLLALVFYLVSTLVQYMVWVRFLIAYQRPGWRDVAIFSRALVLRRLPGGVWHWVGRTALYSEATVVPGRVIMLANFLEWVLLILVGAVLFFAGWENISLPLRLFLALVCTGLALVLSMSWERDHQPWGRRLLESLYWFGLYAIAWVCGGLIIYYLVQASGGASLDLNHAIWVWSAAGGGSMILVIAPTGLGIRELTLTWLLQPYLTPAGALLVAILTRLTFMAADVIWGYVGLGVSEFFLRREAKA
jgi:hypothetical protein